MTTTQATANATGTSWATRLAKALTEVFAPIVLIVFLLFAVTIYASADWRRGVLLAGIAAFFGGVLPYTVMLLGIRAGRLGDRHLRERRERPLMMLFGLASAATGLYLVHAMGAPPELFALVGAMLAGIVVALGVTLFWKISIHSACAAGSVAILAVAVTPWALLLTPVVVATAWARVRLNDHTTAQVTGGAVVGRSSRRLPSVPSPKRRARRVVAKVTEQRSAA